MKCPNCNTENSPEAVRCTKCGALMPTKRTAGALKLYDVIIALITAVGVVALYVGMMFAVVVMWELRYMIQNPIPGDSDMLMQAMNEALARDSVYLNLIFSASSALILAAVFTVRKIPFTDAVNVKPAKASKLIPALAAGLAAQLPLSFILGFIPFSEEMIENHNKLMETNVNAVPAEILYGVILAPIIEELLFRGIAHDRLAKVMPVPVAAAISAMLFAVIHGEIISIVAAFACGFLFAIMYSRFGTVLISIAFHMGFNATAFALPYLPDSLGFAALAGSAVILAVSLWHLMKRDKSENNNTGEIQ